MENNEENHQPLRISLFPRSNLDWNINTWSYTITGNKAAGEYSFEVRQIINSFATPEEKQEQFNLSRASRNYLFSEEEREKNHDGWLKIEVELIHRAFNALLDFAQRESSRLVYFDIAIHLMAYRIEIPVDLKEEIIDYSNFEKYEEYQFFDDDLAEIRKKWLAEFINRVQNHQEGVKTLITHEPLGEVYETTPPDEKGKKNVSLPNIDYSL